MKVRRYLIALTLALTIFVPGVAKAAENLTYNNVTKLEDKKDKKDKKEDYSKILEQAEEYVPGIKEKGQLLHDERVKLKKELRDVLKEKRNNHKEQSKKRHCLKNEELKAQKKKTKDSYQEFVVSVKNGDATCIEKAFKDYFENSSKLNELMRKKIKETKAQ